MFRVDDLKDKVSELKLGDIIEMGPTEDDFNVDLKKHEAEEFKMPVSVRLTEELIRASRIIMNKYKCSSNILYKSSTKLGAMMMMNCGSIKALEDISWFFDILYEKAQDLNDSWMVNVMYDAMEKIAETSNMFRFGKGVSVKKIYPYPKWRLILNKFSYALSTTTSNVYRMSIVYAFSTETNIKSLHELNRTLNIITKKRLATLQDLCNVVKNSASFIKFDYATYINNKLKKRKSLSEEVKKIIEEVLLNE